MVWGMVALATVLSLVRLNAIGFNQDYILPKRVWQVDILQTVSDASGGAEVSALLPTTTSRQNILDAANLSPDFDHVAEPDGPNLVGRWRLQPRKDGGQIKYTVRVQPEAVRFDIDPDIRLSDDVPAGLQAFVAATDEIQVDAADVRELATSLRPDSGSVLRYAQSAFDHVQGFQFRPFKGTTSALTALRLGEASCNGRSRLLVALFRAQNIPARLVGGVILEEGSKRTSHQWMEAFIAGRWVPFDALNHHFAQIPAHYLELYRGDLAEFKHTSGITYRYEFKMRPELVPPSTIAEKRDALGVWSIFEQLGLSLDLLRILIMMPLGAMVIVIFRNVVGLKTFGTFLPTLIAAASTNTGFWSGVFGFVVIVLLTSLVRRAIAPLQLLHSPQLAILLTTTVSLMVVLTFVGAQFGLSGLTRITLFPIAVLAITAERFVLMEAEEGAVEALRTLAWTVVVVFFCYLAISSVALQLLLLSFPELLLVVVAVDIWLGRWLGLRVTEWARFRPVLAAAEIR